MSEPHETPPQPRQDPTAPHSIDAGSGAGRSAVEPPTGGRWRGLALVGAAVVAILVVLLLVA